MTSEHAKDNGGRIIPSTSLKRRHLGPHTSPKISVQMLNGAIEKARADISQLSREELEVFLDDTLGPNYSNVKFFKEGGTRLLFKTLWGPNNEERIVKLDKPESSLTSPRAQRYFKRGYTTVNEIFTIAGLRDAENKGLMPLVDYRDLRPHGVEGEISVEPYFPSKSLEEMIEESGPIRNPKKIEAIFGKIFSAAAEFNFQTNKLHRDLKPSNILIQAWHGYEDQEETIFGEDIRITDFANAKPINEEEQRYFPTAGGNIVTDWRLMGPFTGKESSYTPKSEVYALGRTFLYSITGKHFVEIDPDEGIARAADTGETLLGEDGLIDAKKYEEALDRTLKTLPKKLRKYKPVLKNSLTSDMRHRFDSPSELEHAFKKANKPGILERIVNKRKQIAITGILTSLVLGTAVHQFSRIQGEVEEKAKQQIHQAEKYDVHAEWDGWEPELRNNLVEMIVEAHNETDFEGTRFSEHGFVRANPGDKVWVSLQARELPRQKGLFEGSLCRFPGRVYIEGLPFEKVKKEPKYFPVGGAFIDINDCRNDVIVDTTPVDKTVDQGDYIGLDGNRVVKIPQDGNNRIYILAAEIYSPSQELDSYHSDKIEYPEPGSMISRKRIPIIVGDPGLNVDVGSISFNTSLLPQFEFCDVVENPRPGHRMIARTDIKINYNIIEENHNMDGNKYYILPPGEPEYQSGFGPRTLEVTVKTNDGSPILYTAFPIKRTGKIEDWYGGEAMYFWDFARPGKEFSEKLQGRHPGINHKSGASQK